MIHENIPVSMPGSLKDAHLTTYFLDYYDELPKDQKHPTVIICPGGAYAFLADREAEIIALQFNSMGYNAAVLYYSVAPAVYPAALTEVAASVKMLKDRAEEWRIDKDNIFVMGFSARGHLAASYGVFWNQSFLAERLQCESARLAVKGLILCYPVITSRKEYTHEDSFKNLMGDAFQEEGKEMSLEYHVGPQVPPAFLWHAFGDQSVPFQNSLLFVEAMGKAGVQTEFHLYTGGDHGLSLAKEFLRREIGTGVYEPAQSWFPLLETWIENRCKEQQ